MGEDRPQYIKEIIQGGGKGYPTVWSRDLGHDPQDWEDPWRFQPQGGPPSGGNSANAGHRGKVGLPTSGCGNGGSGVGGGGIINPLPPE